MKVNKQYLIKIIKEEIAKKSYDADGTMAKSNIHNLIKHTKMLSMLISDQDDLEPWVEEKIALATDYIETVAEYLEYEKKGGHD